MNTSYHMRKKRFLLWHAANPKVWDYFEKFTLEAIQKGHRRISHWLILNRVRWEVFLQTTGDDFKISNDYFAFYARLWITRYPQYRFIFKIKRMKDEPWHEDMPL